MFIRREIERINKEVGNFKSLLAANPPDFSLKRAVNVHWNDKDYESTKSYDLESKNGIYFIFDNDGKLVYIGSAIDRFDSRVFMHDDNVQQKYIEVIEFKEDAYVPLILALEFFLISRLKPQGNVKYVGYDVPPPS